MTVSRAAERFPRAERTEVVETLHGVAVSDPYRWLEDPEDPRTVAWAAAQESLFSTERATWPIDAWNNAVAPLSAISLMSSSLVRRDRYFFTRREADDEH